VTASILNFIGFNAILQTFLLSWFFGSSKKGSSLSNRILAAQIFSFGVFILCSIPVATAFESPYFKFAYVMRRVAFVIGPLFFLYIQSVLDRQFAWKRVYWFHFLPFVMMVNVSILSGFLNLSLFRDYMQDYIANSSLLLLQNAVYLFQVSRALLKHRKLNQDAQQAGNPSKMLLWVEVFTMGYSFFWGINLQNLCLISFVSKSLWCPYAVSVFCLIPFILINLLALGAMVKPDFFFGRFSNGFAGIDPVRSEQTKERLLEKMENEKVFLDPDLSITTLAKHVRVAPKQLSTVINQDLRTNFYDLVNRYRIDECVHRLHSLDAERKTLLEIAYDVGFNSKSTFNLAFKKQLNMTPSEYRRNLLASEVSSFGKN